MTSLAWLKLILIRWVALILSSLRLFSHFLKFELEESQLTWSNHSKSQSTVTRKPAYRQLTNRLKAKKLFNTWSALATWIFATDLSPNKLVVSCTGHLTGLSWHTQWLIPVMASDEHDTVLIESDWDNTDEWCENPLGRVRNFKPTELFSKEKYCITIFH